MTDPTPGPDPHSVVRQLIRQAQAGTSSPTPGPSSYADPKDERTSSIVPQSSASFPAERRDADPSSSLTSEERTNELLPYEQISATLASLAADRRELAALLQQKKLLAAAQKRNTTHQQALEKVSHLLVKTRDELKSALHSLDLADILDAEDQSLEVIRDHRAAEDAAAICPFPAAMVQQIPLLRLQSIERAEFDNALGFRIWLDIEDQQLRMAVKAAALKAHTIALSVDPLFKGDPIAEAAKMDEASALRLAEQIESEKQPTTLSRYGRSSNQGLDWATIAGRVPSRSIQEVRTRWNAAIRPSVNTEPWSKHELQDLIRIATPYLHAYLSQPATQTSAMTRLSTQSSSTVPSSSDTLAAPIPWRHVAEQLGTSRTAYACFVAFCSAIVQRDQPDVPQAEDTQIKELFSLFRGAWRFIALHDTTSPNLSPSPPPTPKREATLLGKVGREPQFIYRRFRNTTDPALATGRWSPQEDVLLIHAVRAVGQDNWAAVAARIPGRTSSQCRERWVRRVKQVVDEAGRTADADLEDPEQVAKLLEGKKKLVWTAEMDKALLSCIDQDGDFKGKGGRTFASIAVEVADKTGVALSDKSVRDRLIVLRRNKAEVHAKRGAEGEQVNVPVEAIAGSDPSGPPREPADPPPTEAAVASDARRPRTTIVPGAKRRKL